MQLYIIRKENEPFNFTTKPWCYNLYSNEKDAINILEKWQDKKAYVIEKVDCPWVFPTADLLRIDRDFKVDRASHLIAAV